jgi:peptidoglycan/LPS O-acetylase OafA/YrhL
MRAVAALSILVVHTWEEASAAGRPDFGGLIGSHINDLSYGVTVFFSLSGFLLYRPFAAALLRDGERPRITNYLRNRALRILPAYWVVLLVCSLLIGGILYRKGTELADGRLTDPGLLVRAALLVQNYDPHTFLTGIGPAWSLAVEVVFYLILPLLVLAAFRLGRGRGPRLRVVAALVPAATLFVIGLLGKALSAFVVPADNFWDGWNADWHSVLDKSFLCQADLFSFGMALAVLHSLHRDARLSLPRHWRPAAVGIGLLGYLAASRVSWQEVQLTYSPYNTVMALSCALLLALVVLAEPERSRFVRLLETRPLVAAGTVSYSIFLWHHPLILALKHYGLTFDGRIGLAVNLAIVLAVTSVLSALTYRYVEAPALRLKFSSRRHKTPPSQLEAAP